MKTTKGQQGLLALCCALPVKAGAVAEEGKMNIVEHSVPDHRTLQLKCSCSRCEKWVGKASGKNKLPQCIRTIQRKSKDTCGTLNEKAESVCQDVRNGEKTIAEACVEVNCIGPQPLSEPSSPSSAPSSAPEWTKDDAMGHPERTKDDAIGRQQHSPCIQQVCRCLD